MKDSQVQAVVKNIFFLGQVCNSISWVFSVQTHGKSHCLVTSYMISYETGSGWSKEVERWLSTIISLKQIGENRSHQYFQKTNKYESYRALLLRENKSNRYFHCTKRTEWNSSFTDIRRMLQLQQLRGQTEAAMTKANFKYQKIT